MENNTSSIKPAYAINGTNGNGEAKCPFSSGAIKQSAGGGIRNQDWWPNQLKLNILRQHSSLDRKSVV